MASDGIARLVVGKILNHLETGVTAVYDRHSYDAEKRDAMDAWGRRLLRILRTKKSLALVPVPPSADERRVAS